MSFEDLNQPIPDIDDKIQEISDVELTRIKNEIQHALMVDFGVTDNDGARKWILKYAKDFSEYIHEHLELADMWRNEDTKQIVLQTLIQAERDGFPRKEKDAA